MTWQPRRLGNLWRVEAEVVADFYEKVPLIVSRAFEYAEARGLARFDAEVAPKEQFRKWLVAFRDMQEPDRFEPLLKCWDYYYEPHQKHSVPTAEEKNEERRRNSYTWHAEVENAFIWLWFKGQDGNYRIGVTGRQLGVVTGRNYWEEVRGRSVQRESQTVHAHFFDGFRSSKVVIISRDDLDLAPLPKNVEYDLTLSRDGGSEWSVTLDLRERVGETAADYSDRIEAAPELLRSFISALPGVKTVIIEDRDLIAVSMLKKKSLYKLLRQALSELTNGSLVGLTVDPDVEHND